MTMRPPGVELEPLLCPKCLYEGRTQRTWLDIQILAYICEVHGPAFTVQKVESGR